MTSKTKAILSLISAFIFGFAVCFFLIYFSVIDRQVHHRPSPEKFTSNLIEKFTLELSLNASQVEALKMQLQQLRAQHDSLRVHGNDANVKIRENFRREFAKILTPEQQLKFAEFNKEEDRKFRH
jgi:hypothetical protein